MSLIGALNIGKRALAVHQAAIQVTSNNVANAGNPDYTRQVARIVTSPDQELRPGSMIGTGVSLASIERQIDEALEERIRGSITDSETANVRQQWLGRVEAVFNELSDDDLSTQLNKFFSSWSNLNPPEDMSLRQVIVRDGQSLASTFRNMNGQLGSLQNDINARLESLSRDADGLLSQVADLNKQIVGAEGAGGMANGLRDQRDAVLKRLAELMDIRTQQSINGAVNVYVGSEPLVQETWSRGVQFSLSQQEGESVVKLTTRTDGNVVMASGGQMGALLGVREEIRGVMDQLDGLAGNLIFELNALHSQGHGLDGLSQASSTQAVDDAAAVLNGEDAGLAFQAVNGGFLVHVRQPNGGQEKVTLVQVDLDGRDGDDTTLNSLAAQLDSIDGIAASISGGKLRIQGENGATFGFSQDTSKVLAALGINSFFSGSTASDIEVNSEVAGNARLVAASQIPGAIDNKMAQAIGALHSTRLTSLGGATLEDRYLELVNGVSVAASGAVTGAQAADAVRETLTAQREALSGVSLDEEAVNLMREQRAFQGAARVIAAVDEMLRTLIQMV